jgi:transcriptional regulator with XRE-family HTH domain
MALWSKEVFAKNLRKYMEGRGITQKELAEKIGVSAPTMNDWLQSKKYPRIDKIEKLADVEVFFEGNPQTVKTLKPLAPNGLRVFEGLKIKKLADVEVYT